MATGCASTIDLYSKSPEPTKPGKIRFISQDGAHVAFSLFKESRNCTGIQRVAFFQSNVDETVYLPYQKYLTFNAYIQLPGVSKFNYGGRTISVPFESGELRISLEYDSNNFYTNIEKLDSNKKWVKILNYKERQPVAPFLESGILV